MLSSEVTFALQALVVKNNRVLFSLDESEADSLSINAIVVSTDKSTQVKLMQVSGTRALGQVIKGTAKVNMSFRQLSAGNGVRSSSTKKSNTNLGILAGVSINSMNIKVNTTTTLNLQGSAFNILGIFDYHLMNNFTLRGAAGYEGFKASVASSTCASGTCAVTLNYLSAEGFAQYDAIEFNGGSRFWLGVGVGGLMSISASSEIINTDSMKTNQIFILGSGVDVRLDNNTYLPIQVDYFIYPDGDIKTTQLNVRLGYKF